MQVDVTLFFFSSSSLWSQKKWKGNMVRWVKPPDGRSNAPLDSCCVLCVLCKARWQLLSFHSSFSVFPQLSTHPALFLYHVIKCLFKCVMTDLWIQWLSEKHCIYISRLFRGFLSRFPSPWLDETFLLCMNVCRIKALLRWPKVSQRGNRYLTAHTTLLSEQGHVQGSLCVNVLSHEISSF